MSYSPRLNVDALILPLSDVVIDTSLTYREVVRQTVQLYFERAVGLASSTESLLTSAEVTLLQKQANFTSYWDLTAALVMYFIGLLPPMPSPTFPLSTHVPALLAYLQIAGERLNTSIEVIREQKNIAQLAQDVAEAGGGLRAAVKILPRTNRHLLVMRGNLTEANLVARIFQELYLGADLFEETYDQQAIMIQSTGYIEYEKLLIDREVLTQLSQTVALATISNRPQPEVERSLAMQEIEPLFQSVISLDQVNRVKASPIPHPWSLLETVRRLNPTPWHCAYVGVNIGDIQAARKANESTKILAIGCLEGAHDQVEMERIFKENQADLILGHPNDLKELILG